MKHICLKSEYYYVIYQDCNIKTYQWFITFHQLYYFNSFLVFIYLDRDFWQMRIEIFLCNRIMSGQQALQYHSQMNNLHSLNEKSKAHTYKGSDTLPESGVFVVNRIFLCIVGKYGTVVTIAPELPKLPDFMKINLNYLSCSQRIFAYLIVIKPCTTKFSVRP